MTEHYLVTAVDDAIAVHVLVFQVTGLGVVVDDTYTVGIAGDLAIGIAHDIILGDKAQTTIASEGVDTLTFRLLPRILYILAHFRVL